MMQNHPQKWILREFDESRIRPRLGGLPHFWNFYMAKFDPGWEGYPVWQAELPLADHLTYHVNEIKFPKRPQFERPYWIL